MDVSSAIRGRRSIRKFRPDPVSQETIREILDEARWAPSWANTQCWNIYVVTGEALEKLKAANRQAGQHGETSAPDITMPREWPGHLKERTLRMMKQQPWQSPAVNGIEARPVPAPGMSDLHGATCLLLFCIGKRVGEVYACLDLGLIVQSVCLAAHDRGLGTCIMATVVRYPGLLRQQLPRAKDKRFVIGVALGHPDWESPINQFERERADLDELVTWVR
jgi:nitroreductase